jgi:hypothetical protein
MVPAVPDRVQPCKIIPLASQTCGQHALRIDPATVNNASIFFPDRFAPAFLSCRLRRSRSIRHTVVLQFYPRRAFARFNAVSMSDVTLFNSAAAPVFTASAGLYQRALGLRQPLINIVVDGSPRHA